MALMEITVIPLGTGSPSVGKYIADIERFLRDKNIEHSLNDMATVISGPTEALLRLASEIHRIPLKMGVQRVITQITLDERSDLDRKIGEKQQSVKQRLGDMERQ